MTSSAVVGDIVAKLENPTVKWVAVGAGGSRDAYIAPSEEIAKTCSQPAASMTCTRARARASGATRRPATAATRRCCGGRSAPCAPQAEKETLQKDAATHMFTIKEKEEQLKRAKNAQDEVERDMQR